MSGAFLSLSGGWWTRLLRRVNLLRASGEGEETAVQRGEDLAEKGRPYFPAGAGIDDVGKPLSGVKDKAVREARREEEVRSLAETLGVDSVPAPEARSWVADPKVRERTRTALHDLQQIPALQSLAQGFLQAMNQPEVTVDELVEAIAKDSALCVRVLRMANSVLVSSEQRIEDLDTAVQMLGVMRVRKVARALFTLRDAKQVAEGFDWRHLWIHALGTAAIAEELERFLRPVPDPQLYLAALLHDLGKIVLSTVAQDDYRDVLVAAWHESGRLEELERARLGVDHREAGVLFAKASGLPEMVVEAIAHHDRPESAEHHRFEVALVTVANYLSKAHGLGFSGSRLDASDDDWNELPAWDVIAETCGVRPDVDMIEDELSTFATQLREDLRELREIV